MKGQFGSLVAEKANKTKDMVTNNQNIYYRRVMGLTKGKVLAITLPKRCTELLSISKGDFLRLIQNEGRIAIEKV